VVKRCRDVTAGAGALIAAIGVAIASQTATRKQAASLVITATLLALCGVHKTAAVEGVCPVAAASVDSIPCGPVTEPAGTDLVMKTFETLHFLVALDSPEQLPLDIIGDGFDLDDVLDWIVRLN
jgi:hypothetical protein